MVTKPKDKTVKIVLELTDKEYDEYFRIPKAEYKEKTDVYRTNTNVWRDQMAENKHHKTTGKQKSQRIEQLYSEGLELKKNTKDYIESLKMTCEKCGNNGMSIKLDYDIMAAWKEKGE